ncbi:Dolichyl-monophosphooligosaccharide--protein glycotransferase AglB [Candidatus Methanoperedenaceae archaeon GB50]|nr:Dolichyl-monophosphooligosaccharide--protein glycotransferase AglB [Candidatus Methanoperedenaceae archaeon GB50]CAD7774411.1 MAG: Dolichyl-monophosphooligosaccharide--protein glycotransferase AglB [Candidatus Methanoperedenaceae archaeon GB50]
MSHKRRDKTRKKTKTESSDDPVKREGREEVVKGSKIFDKIVSMRSLPDQIEYALLIILFFISYYIRAVVPHDITFRQGIVGFAYDDAVFHMRLVENTIANFPHRLTYDAFTHYPYGSHLHWGPLFDQVIALFAIIIGGGNPTQETINTVGAYFPAAMGALILFPAYFIARELFDRKAGLVSATLAVVLPGQYLSRTTMGFTDNHVWEIFFTTLMMALLVMALNRSKDLTLDMVRRKEWQSLKRPMTYTFFAGIAFGAYLLTWPPGVLFSVIVGIFFVIQAVINQIRGRNIEYLSIVGSVFYGVAFLMILPVFDPANGFDPGHYSYLHLVFTGFGVVLLLSLSLLLRILTQKDLARYYPIFIAGSALLGLALMKTLLPEMYASSVGQFSFIFKGRTGGGLTIAEAMPMVDHWYHFYKLSPSIKGNFTTLYHIALAGIVYAGYRLFKDSKPGDTLLLVWSLIMLFITLAQNRFAYYYAVNVAVLSAGIGSLILRVAEWNKLDEAYNKNPIDALKGIRIWHIIAVFVILAVFIYPPADATILKGATRGGSISEGYYEWYETLTWMRENTPDPGLDYYGTYEMPPRGEKYPYPDTAYGVMSWWDYGHIITYWGHRIPNANPFQAGIGGGESHAPGASTYLTAQSEEEANKVLDALGVNGRPGARYVATNAYMAYAIQTVFAEWNMDTAGYYRTIEVPQNGEMRTVTIPTEKYYNTMASRLHILDGSGLKHYRLIHESTPNPHTRGGNMETQYKYIYNQVYGGDLKLEESGYAKLFEYVKGANITGNAPDGATITITNTIETNIRRTFTYRQRTKAVNGTYTLTVPYSTEGPIKREGYTNFDTKPREAYTLQAGNKTVEVQVPEEAVMKGETITVNMT